MRRLASTALRISRVASSAARLSSGCATDIHSTTIVCVKKNGIMAMVGDGQMSMGSMIVKPNAKKVRRIGKEDGIVTGFAGATADAMTLLDRLERKLEEFPGQLLRSCVELAKGWRTDKYLRRLEAMMIVADGACACLLKIIYAAKGNELEHALTHRTAHSHPFPPPPFFSTLPQARRW